MIELVLCLDSFCLLPVKRFEYLDWSLLFRLLLRLCRLDGLRQCDPWGLYGLDLLNQRLRVTFLPCLEPDQLASALHVLIPESLSLELDLFDLLILDCVVPVTFLLLLIDFQELLSATTHFIRNLSVLFVGVSEWLLLRGGGFAIQRAREDGSGMTLGQF